MIYQNVINLSFSLQINFDIEEMAKFREERLSQPFLLCLMPTNFDVPPSFFLIIDFTYIPCGNDCVSAFKTLFSSFYVFKSKYPKLLGPFYKFFEEAVFSITPSITPTVAALLPPWTPFRIFFVYVVYLLYMLYMHSLLHHFPLLTNFSLF